MKQSFAKLPERQVNIGMHRQFALGHNKSYYASVGIMLS
jgi:hypothetical protein